MLVPSAGQKIPVQSGWYLPPHKNPPIPLAENRFLQARKGAENTKEKSWQCFIHLRLTHHRIYIYPLNSCRVSHLGSSLDDCLLYIYPLNSCRVAILELSWTIASYIFILEILAESAILEVSWTIASPRLSLRHFC